MTGISSIIFGSLPHDKIGYTINFDGSPLTVESQVEVAQLIRDHAAPPYPIVLRGPFPDEDQLFPLTTVLRDDGYPFGWITNGRYIPANRTDSDYWIVEFPGGKWLVHRCHELWWNGEGEAPVLPNPIPALYLTCGPKPALKIIKSSGLLWNVIPATATTHQIREVLYEAG